MADLTITAASVVKINVSSLKSGTAGSTITAGQHVVKAADDSKWDPADANNDLSGLERGIALNGASDGQPVDVLVKGTIDLGATLTAGAIYVGSANAGGIAPHTDLGSGIKPTYIGVGSSADTSYLIVNCEGTAGDVEGA